MENKITISIFTFLWLICTILISVFIHNEQKKKKGLTDKWSLEKTVSVSALISSVFIFFTIITSKLLKR